MLLGATGWYAVLSSCATLRAPASAVERFGTLISWRALIENVHGYTLTGDHLQPFSGLVFDLGKVVATGDAIALRRRFPDAQVVDGQDKTLLPGLIDAHGHVLSLGFTNTQIALFDTESLLTVRLYAMIWETGGDFKALSKHGPLVGYGNDFLTVRSVKLLAHEAMYAAPDMLAAAIVGFLSP